jgi:AcrR family transcriptional regulator
LLAAGTELFAERGFAGATAQLIARRAGVNKAMINYHFRSKRGLYEAILTGTIGEALAGLEGLRDSARPASEVLREYVSVFGEIARRHPRFPAMLLREVVSGGQLVSPQVIASFLSVLSIIRGLVERGVREGSLRPVDPVLTHLSLVGSLMFFFATESFRRRVLAEAKLPASPPTNEDYVRHMQELVVRGLAPEAGPARR